MKEFYPLDNWQVLEDLLLNAHSFAHVPIDGHLDESEIKALNSEVNRSLLKACSTVQADAEWILARESITYQHRVEVLITPNGMTRPITLTVDMSNIESGFEDKLIGKSVSSVPAKMSFIVGKVAPKHTLYNFAGKQMSCTLAIQNVFKPPFKLITPGDVTSLEEWTSKILDTLRGLPFQLSEKLALVLRQNPGQTAHSKAAIRAIGDFLVEHAQVPKNFKKIILNQIHELGPKFDPEMELSFTETLFYVYCDQRNRYSPSAFQANIEALFVERFKEIMNNIINQMTQQQKDIRLRLSNFAEVESERQRLIAMAQELEVQKKKGVGDEILRRSRQDLQKLAHRIQRKIRQYESSKGIILIQELYLSAVEKSEHLKETLGLLRNNLTQLKSLLQANHISAARDIEALTHSLGVHAHHLLVQHAIYSEVEPDMNHVVSLESLEKFEEPVVRPLLNLMPTVRDSLQGLELNSDNLLKAIFTGDVPEREKNAFMRFCDENPEPKNNQIQRFSQQTQQFIQVSRVGRGLDGVVSFLETELSGLKAVLRFAAEQNKLNTDFKNHMRYYEKVFILPYLSLLENSKHALYEELDRTYDKLSNTLKVQMEIRYSALEEKALLSMFRHINAQLQNENLFAAAVFTKQVKHFMTQLTRYKDKIPPVLMKKILETYTIYMMGSSRTRNLSREKVGLSQEDLQRIKSSRETLTV